MIGFANKLHITVFNAVVYHFDIVACAIFPDIGRARITVYLGRYSSKNWFHQLIGILLTAWHDCRTFQRTFFAARNARSNKAEALSLQLFVSSLCIREIGVSAVDQNIPLT
ncbi:hypothetical protein D3C77_653280 [compost metagenome]